MASGSKVANPLMIIADKKTLLLDFGLKENGSTMQATRLLQILKPAGGTFSQTRLELPQAVHSA